MNSVEADGGRSRHRAINVIHQALDQVVHVKDLHRDVPYLLEVGVVATVVGDEHQLRRTVVISLEKLPVFGPQFLLYCFTAFSK